MSIGDDFAKKRFNVTKTLVTAGFIVSLATLLVVILSCVYISVIDPRAPLPDFLNTAGSASLGYIFGTFPKMIQDFLEY